jgi:hypothetical protein
VCAQSLHNSTNSRPVNRGIVSHKCDAMREFGVFVMFESSLRSIVYKEAYSVSISSNIRNNGTRISGGLSLPAAQAAI